MINCGKISLNISDSCENPIIAGTGERAWIINYNDVLEITYNITNPMIVEVIELKPSTKAFYIDGKQNSIAPYYELIKVISDTHLHRVSFQLFDIDPSQKENLTGAITGKYIVIVELKTKGVDGSSAFEIYGLNGGLKNINLDKNPNNQDNQGAFNFVLEGNCQFMPKNFFFLSYSATLAIIEALLVENVNNAIFTNNNNIIFTNNNLIAFE